MDISSGLDRFLHPSGGRDGLFLLKLWITVARHNREHCGGLLFPQHRLTMAKIEDGILAFSTCGSCISSLFGSSLLLPPWSLLPLLYLQQFPTQQIVKGRRQEEGALGGSCTLLPSSISGQVTMHSNGVNPTQGSSSCIKIAATLTVLTSLRKES